MAHARTRHHSRTSNPTPTQDFEPGSEPLGTAVVTGAGGFIGSAVVRALLRRGRRVRAVIEPGSSRANLDELSGLDIIEADITRAREIRDALATDAPAQQTIFHLAALYRTWLPDPSLMYRVNVEGTANVLLAAQSLRVRRVVHTSSVAAIGSRPDGAPSNEQIAFNHFAIANDYILSKYLSDQLAQRFAQAGLPVVIVNPGFPFGPRDLAPTPTGAIIMGLLDGRIPAVSSGGFAAIDVDDLAEGHVLAEEKGRLGERYILTNHNVTMAEFARRVLRQAGSRRPALVVPKSITRGGARLFEWWANHVSHHPPIATYKSARYIEQQNFFDHSKAKNELGLPSRPLEETIQRAIDWFEKSRSGS